MFSKYLSALSNEEYAQLKNELFEIQNSTCYICQKAIDLELNTTNIDHIEPLAKGGKDSIDNFALTHESCNKSKQDASLSVARILSRLNNIKENADSNGEKATLHHVLDAYEGRKYDFKYSIEDKYLKYSYSEVGDNEVYKAKIFIDKLSGEKTVFIDVPIEYIHHDSFINPRGINNSISLLVKEFKAKFPQLHLSLGRIEENKIKIFDGQHKAVAQILLGNRIIPVRLFVSPDIDRLVETNTHAGSSLRQIAFDKSIMRQLHYTLYNERIKKYQKDHQMFEDDFSFSEQQLVDYFKGEANIKKYIIDNTKYCITNDIDNKLKSYIDFEGKAKELPISYSTFDKTILSCLIDSKLILSTQIDYKADEGLNPRQIEINQIVSLLNILADEIYVDKFNPEIGVHRIEQKIIDKKDNNITENHLIAYRISKEEIMYNWMLYLKKVVESYFTQTGHMYENNKLFQEPFPDQLWSNIRNFVKNLIALPLWKDKSMASTTFAGKNNYEFWKTIFEKGERPDGAKVLARPLNFTDMIKPMNN